MAETAIELTLAAAIALGLVPLAIAWWANRATSLRDAFFWAVLAWLSWFPALAHPSVDAFLFVALCLTSCAGVAVLGARRPHVFAWNFVVLGLAGVLLLPLLEGLVIQVDSFNIERKIFVGIILTLTIANYIPTRFGAAAIALGTGCLMMTLLPTLRGRWPGFFPEETYADGILILLAPWLGLLSNPMPPKDPFQAEWAKFRDRFGLVWGLRVKEQFHRAAHNANLKVELTWRGWKIGDHADVEQAGQIFQSLTKRFL